jgi:DNA-binding CsgD family transcriptional regulator
VRVVKRPSHPGFPNLHVTPPSPIDEALLRELWPTGESLASLATRWGCSHNAVFLRARKLGLPPRAISTGARPQNAMVRAYEEGMSTYDIAKQLGMSKVIVWKILRRRGVKLRPRGGRVSTTLQPECIKLRRRGLTYKQIGKRLGLTPRQVSLRLRLVLGAPRKKAVAS